METFDVLIIGGGCAGLAAAMYSGRFGLKTVVLAEIPGGTIILTDVVENYPGFKKLTGLELAQKLQEHAEAYPSVSIKNERVIDLKKEGKIFEATTDEHVYKAKSVIYATGTKWRKLGVPGEDTFANKGVHYCALCVLPGTKVITNPSSRQIQFLKEGEKVFTREGKFEKIHATLKKDYNGEIVNLRPRYFHKTLKLTADHLVLAARPLRNHPNYRLNCKREFGEKWMDHLKNVIMYDPAWIPAKDLRKGDYLLYPIMKEVKDKTEIKISEVVEVLIDKDDQCYNKQETHTSVRIPNTISLNDDFLYLIGYYIAEGHSSRGLVFSFEKTEKEYVEEVASLIKKVFKVEAYIDESATSLQVKCYSSIIGEFFKALFGEESFSKKLPIWALFLSKEKQGKIFRTMWFGDGYKREKGLHYVTSSEQLAYQLKLIFLRMGAIPHFFVKTIDEQNKKTHKINGRIIHAKHDKYELEIGGAWLEPICKLMNIQHDWIKERKSVNYFGWFDGDHAVIPINSLSKENYVGPVFDLTVENSHSFVTDVACVHNCDGAFYKDKVIAVVGGADSAAKEALLLTQWGSKVFIIYRGEQIHPEPVNLERVKKNKKIEVITKTNVIEIKGDKKVTHVMLDKEFNGSKELKVDAVFVEIGHIALSDLAKKIGVNLDKKGEIMIDRLARTNVEGFFAAGDVVDTEFKQAITGVGEAVSASYSAYKYLTGEEL
ncbi:MAG: FAD-dependent oxidoreductase [Candidatus Nanoarchaeia archaeon]